MSDNPPVPASEPSLAPTPAPVPAQSLQVACPNCFTIVSPGTAYCPNCGSAIPPSYPLVPQSIAIPPRKSRIGLVIGIILVVLLVGGAAGYVFYYNAQQQVLQAAKTTETADANQAPSQIRFTCLSVTPDSSHLQYNQTNHIFSGYALINEKFGLSDPTRFAIDATWVMTIDFTAISLVTSSTSSFHLGANAAAYPIFAFRITGSQYNSLPANPDFTKFITTLDAAYTVTGTYSTYHLTQHSSYNSVTGTGTGTLVSTANTSPCPASY